MTSKRLYKTSVLVLALLWLIPDASAQKAAGVKAPAADPVPPLVIPAGVVPDPKTAGELFKSLGPLSRDLFAAYSMDRREDASLVFSRIPIDAMFSDNVSFGVSEGRQSADFTGDNAVMIFGRLRFGPAYTLCGWVFLPALGGVGTIWQGDEDAGLFTEGNSFSCWKNQPFNYCSLPKSAAGWHHVAVTCDGRRLAFYLDGERKATQPFAIDSALRSVGNHWKQNLRDRHVSRMDDLLFFTRELTEEEIGLVGQVRISVSLLPARTVADRAPAPWISRDIGSPPHAGFALQANDTFTVAGEGKDISGSSDQFHYLYRSLSGDGAIVARVATQQGNLPWAKAGVMIRDTLAADSTHAFLSITPGNGTAFEFRTRAGDSTHGPNVVGVIAPYWLKLVRSGDTLIGSRSVDGVAWREQSAATVPMGSTVTIGLAVCSHDSGMMNVSNFDHVSIREMVNGFPATSRPPLPPAKPGNPADAAKSSEMRKAS